VICTGRVSRRSNAWVLAWTQVAITGVVSALITVWLPAPNGFQNTLIGLRRVDVQLAMAFMICFTTVFGFWGISKMQGYLTSTEAAVVYSFEPLVAALVGVFWVGEHFLPSQQLGAGLILLAMVVAEFMPRLIARIRPEELGEAPAD
jgi:drug/metabolite transporter (DMT)-like permease